MTQPGAFLFDLDGTLADTLPDIAASTNHVRRAHGLEPCDEALVRRMVGDGARMLLVRALAEVLPPEGAAREAFVDAASATYTEHHLVQCTQRTRLYPGVLEHLAALRERGHALAVVTNKPLRFAGPVCAHLGITELVGAVVGGDSVPQKKPDPAPLRFALEQLGVSATGATMVGDGLQDLRAGRALGLGTIGCLYGYGDPDALRAERADGYWRAFGVPAR
ncbi:MAG: HAD hydrolase-like protein [Planctomycetes bacterium]|nr:HAD hydrolase-like protein [Planctomycetota bacterium]